MQPQSGRQEWFTSPFFWLFIFFPFTLQPRQGHSRPCIWAAICFRPISRGVLSPALLGPLVLYCPQSSSPEKYLTGTHHQPGPSLNQFLPRYITCWQMALPPKQQKKEKEKRKHCWHGLADPVFGLHLMIKNQGRSGGTIWRTFAPIDSKPTTVADLVEEWTNEEAAAVRYLSLHTWKSCDDPGATARRSAGWRRQLMAEPASKVEQRSASKLWVTTRKTTIFTSFILKMTKHGQSHGALVRSLAPPPVEMLVAEDAGGWGL